MLEPLKVDGHGRIENWPEGFMDDDVRESRRLLDIMYGPTPHPRRTTEPWRLHNGQIFVWAMW